MTQRLLNIRRMFAPDPGFVIVDADIAGADAMVFAWEVGDGPFKQNMVSGAKIHVVSNRYMFPDRCGPEGKAEPYYTQVKSAFHGTDYGAGYRTLAANLSWPEWQAQKFQKWHFERFPEIKAYHRRVEEQIMTTREVCNQFGYRIHFFDDIKSILPEALAWVPQSTVAIVCFRAALLLRKLITDHRLPIQILLQVHDSLVFQIRRDILPIVLPQIRDLFLSVVVPYPEPLRMKWSFKISAKSWGDCHAVDWDRIAA